MTKGILKNLRRSGFLDALEPILSEVDDWRPEPGGKHYRLRIRIGSVVRKIAVPCTPHTKGRARENEVSALRRLVGKMREEANAAVR